MLDGFRAWAILGVVVFHVLILSAPWAGGGGDHGLVVWLATGGLLDTFFIVSGCSLFLPVVRRGGLGELRLYARKRAARVLPAFWLALTVALVLSATVQGAIPGAGELAIQYAGLGMPARALDAGMPIGFGNVPLWMVSVIVGLYVLFPFVVRPFLRHPFASLAAAAAITVAWKLATPSLAAGLVGIESTTTTAAHLEPILVDQMPGWVFAFALGMFCAWAYIRFAESRPAEQLERWAVRAAPLALVLFCACAYLYAQAAMESSGLTGGPDARSSALLSLAFTTTRGALMAVIALGPALLAKPFANRFTRAFAQQSYGVYVIHYVVGVYVCSMLLDLPADGSYGAAALWLAVVLPLSYCFAWLTTRYVEQRARVWATRRRASTGRRALSGVADPSLRPRLREP